MIRHARSSAMSLSNSHQLGLPYKLDWSTGFYRSRLLMAQAICEPLSILLKVSSATNAIY